MTTSICEVESVTYFRNTRHEQSIDILRAMFACVEQVRLRERYWSLILAYQEMVILLDNVSSHDDFVETFQQAEKVRLLFERARAELLNHLQEHGCDVMLEAIRASETPAHIEPFRKM